MNPPLIMPRSNPEIKDAWIRNRLLPLCGFLILLLLVLRRKIYALPLAILWLIARWRKDSRSDRIGMMIGIAVVYAIAYLFAGSAAEKADWTIIFILPTLLAPVLNRFTRKESA
jgi:hypothetical protein